MVAMVAKSGGVLATLCLLPNLLGFKPVSPTFLQILWATFHQLIFHHCQQPSSHRCLAAIGPCPHLQQKEPWSFKRLWLISAVNLTKGKDVRIGWKTEMFTGEHTQWKHIHKILLHLLKPLIWCWERDLAEWSSHSWSPLGTDPCSGWRSKNLPSITQVAKWQNSWELLGSAGPWNVRKKRGFGFFLKEALDAKGLGWIIQSAPRTSSASQTMKHWLPDRGSQELFPDGNKENNP